MLNKIKMLNLLKIEGATTMLKAFSDKFIKKGENKRKMLNLLCKNEATAMLKNFVNEIFTTEKSIEILDLFESQVVFRYLNLKGGKRCL